MTTARDVIALTCYPSAEHQKYGKTFSIIGEDRADLILAALEAAGKKVVDREPTKEMVKNIEDKGAKLLASAYWRYLWDLADTKRKEP